MKRVYYLVIPTVLEITVYNCSFFVYFMYNKFKNVERSTRFAFRRALNSTQEIPEFSTIHMDLILNSTTVLCSSVCVALICYTSLINHWKGYILSLK